MSTALPPPSDPSLAARLEASFKHTARLAAKLDQPNSAKFKRPRIKFKTKAAHRAALEELSETKAMQIEPPLDETPPPDYV